MIFPIYLALDFSKAGHRPHDGVLSGMCDLGREPMVDDVFQFGVVRFAGSSDTWRPSTAYDFCTPPPITFEGERLVSYGNAFIAIRDLIRQDVKERFGVGKTFRPLLFISGAQEPADATWLATYKELMKEKYHPRVVTFATTKAVAPVLADIATELAFFAHDPQRISTLISDCVLSAFRSVPAGTPPGLRIPAGMEGLECYWRAD